MKISSRCACAVFAGSIILAACAQPTGLSGLQYTPHVDSLHQGGAGPMSYRVLHSFGGDHDGNAPNSGLLYRADAFYGTTYGGGSEREYCGTYGGCGTVFSMTTSGAEQVLHSFGGTESGGRLPYASLIDIQGTLYGTTGYGGTSNDGTVFSITPVGKEKILHNFGEGSDGEYPLANLLDVSGTLYGTTSNGGTNLCGSSENGCGTVFSVTTSGTYHVLYNFRPGTDAQNPDAGLIDVHGTLYGTTYNGGITTCGNVARCGTVFSVTTSGKETVLHRFDGADGSNPAFALTSVKGTLYGTTSYGGAYGGGLVFSMTIGGKEKVLHSFGKGNDGSFPYGSLISVDGTLYGATNKGGAYGFGTVFSITTGGKEKVLHDFGKVADGRGPAGSLTYEDGNLYGATLLGGTHRRGAVFALRLDETKAPKKRPE